MRMLGVALDITGRKRAEEKIHRREAQLAEAQRVAHLGSYEWDIPNNIVHRSEELCRIFGSPSEELPPTFEGYLERVHPEDRDTTRKTIEDALRERKPFEFEERIVRPDGEIRVLHSLGNGSSTSRQAGEAGRNLPGHHRSQARRGLNFDEAKNAFSS